ncbi:MAG: tryptophan synthase subunit alpha [Pseudomonadota bacterium]
MQAHERITQSIRSAAERGGALVPFLTAGYPVRDEFVDRLREIAPSADVIEVGVPFSDPMADGMTIQRSSHQAIENGVTLRWILEQLRDVRADLDTPVVLMSYLNPMLAYGLDELAQDALSAGVCGFIVPDLPFEESAPVREALESAGIGLIQLVTPATPPARIATLCAESRGFVYAVTVTGITGGQTGLPSEVSEYLQRVREASPLPVCAGFGIRSQADVARINACADGAIVGSALVEVLEQRGDAGAFVAGLRG